MEEKCQPQSITINSISEENKSDWTTDPRDQQQNNLVNHNNNKNNESKMIYPQEEIPKRIDKETQVDLTTKQSDFTVSWTNLTYRVKISRLDKMIHKFRGVTYSSDSRVVLNRLNGSFSSSQLTALMGPSGAGKSTLLECIAGMRVRGLEGDIRLHGRSKVSIGFLPQHDQLYGLLTVREALTYASELQHSRYVNGKCPKMSREDHRAIVNAMLHQLNLDVCADTKIDRISGGQIKRVSIGQELVASPDILIMDEPTSGLDSSTCYQLMEMLSDLVKRQPIAIVMTIHQPSARVFSMFQKVYMLSRRGRFIYEGHPDGVVSALATVDITCSQFNNPADLLVEVASGDYGSEIIQEMANNVENARQGQTADKLPFNGSVPLQRNLIRPVAPFWRHFVILLARQTIVMIRDPLLGVLRFFFAFNIAITLGVLYWDKGQANGCVPDVRGLIGLNHLDQITELIEEQVRATMDNIGSLYFLLLYSCLANLMPMAVAIPMEIKIFAKERYNGWYKTSSYYMAKGLAEVPFIMGTNLVVVTLHFLFTSQPMDRYLATLNIYFLVSLVAQTHGIMCGAFLMNNIVASVFTAPNTTVPLILFSGFFIRYGAMPVVFQFSSYFSYLRFGFEGFMVALFGFNRCDRHLTKVMISARNQLETFVKLMFRMGRESISEANDEPEDMALVNQTNHLAEHMVHALGGSWFNEEGASGAIKYYKLTDQDYYYSVLALCVTLFIGRLLTYFILKWRGNLRK